MTTCANDEVCHDDVCAVEGCTDVSDASALVDNKCDFLVALLPFKPHRSNRVDAFAAERVQLLGL